MIERLRRITSTLIFLRTPALALLCTISSCTSIFNSPELPYSTTGIWAVIDSVAEEDGGWMYADEYRDKLYTASHDSLYWISAEGVDERADVLLAYLKNIGQEGLDRKSFHYEDILEDLERARALKPDSCTEEEVSNVMGRLEYRLMTAYLRYASGQRYGYTRPKRLFGQENFDLRTEEATDSFFHVAIEQLKDDDRLEDFLDEIQPNNSLHTLLSETYTKELEAGNTDRLQLLRTNLERSRWRYRRPETTGKLIFVNLPTQQLTAINHDTGDNLSMKICFGQTDHQTPLLTSNITHIDLNPYWIIPYSIIQNELATAHVHDSAYYNRNKIVAINKQTKEQLDAASLSYDQLISGNYTLRQEKGEGNSLGRIIFRFPNKYSVFLHDTNSPRAFNRETRTVSHGCVRVQKPLDLAFFLMDEPDSLLLDKIRIAIDKAPLTEEGMLYKENTEPEKFMSRYNYKPSIPVFIDYYTLYPDSDGNLQSYPDVYGYDKKLQETLQQF